MEARGEGDATPATEDEELAVPELSRKGDLFPGDEEIDPVRYESGVPGGDAGGVLFVEYTDCGLEVEPIGLEADFLGVD